LKCQDAHPLSSKYGYTYARLSSAYRRLKANLQKFITDLILPKILIKEGTDRLLGWGVGVIDY
jgi:hypothetical protein